MSIIDENVTESQISTKIEAILDTMLLFKDFVSGLNVLKKQVDILSQFDTENSRYILNLVTSILDKQTSSAVKSTSDSMTFLNEITNENILIGHKDLFNKIKDVTLIPMLNGFDPISNIMLVYGLAGSGQDRLAIAIAEWLKNKIERINGLNGVRIQELNCFGSKDCKNRIWKTFSISENRAKELCRLYTIPEQRKSIKFIILLKDVDLISKEIQEELLVISKSDEFPHVFLIATSSAPYNILPALQQRFYPRTFVNLPSKTTMRNILTENIYNYLKSDKKETYSYNEALQISQNWSLGTEFTKKLNTLLCLVADESLGFKFKTIESVNEEISKALIKFESDNGSENYLKHDVNIVYVYNKVKLLVPSFNIKNRFKFGYNYEDVINLAKLIYIRLTCKFKEKNTLKNTKLDLDYLATMDMKFIEDNVNHVVSKSISTVDVNEYIRILHFELFGNM
jgi:hypothetical protein